MAIIKTDILMWSPTDAIDQECIKFIQGTKESLLVADYSFNLVPAVDAIIERAKAGIKVKLVLDHSQSLGSTEVPQIQRLLAANAGIEIVIGTSSVGHQIMHQKFMVKDARVTWWGSWNITRMASSQANTVNIISDQEIAGKFTEDFEGMRSWILANELHYQLPTLIPLPVLPANG